MEKAFNQEIHEFAVYSQRSHLGKYLTLFLVSDLLCIALLLCFLFLATGFSFVRPSPEPALTITVQIFMAAFSLPSLFLVLWLSFFALFTMRRLGSHEPALLITHEGINFRDLPVTGNNLLCWGEIASLSIVSVYQRYGKPINYFCLDPKEHVQFLSRFHPLRRFFVRIGSLATGTLINVPQWFLLEPVEEVLSQIQETFQEKLRTYEVQILSTRSARESL